MTRIIKVKPKSTYQVNHPYDSVITTKIIKVEPKSTYQVSHLVKYVKTP
ncbi:11142_t:CDS:2 [Racocetra fulgida]|uniref:11142_t:CDS:1 n=1 Tax=Racocetra fulgida TaxID=60492 RepID=A0A9N8WIP9_9GLOM|nr:11142_t:CDS:2 [Racocetra fulgida]